MNLQRIVKLKALSGAVFCFSHQRLNVGIEKEFGTENCAAVFIEQFHFASLDDLREIASWTSKEVSFAHEYEDKGIEELDQLLAKGLYDRVFCLYQNCLSYSLKHSIHQRIFDNLSL
ncbi:hypothetical protein OGZ01_27545 [Vibrio harveyi]|nr:hypothetical protein [Vibrio harveyi]